eukprot:SAG22_NODE_80_length_21788_cov_9.742542_5_plen_75_part_00
MFHQPSSNAASWPRPFRSSQASVAAEASATTGATVGCAADRYESRAEAAIDKFIEANTKKEREGVFRCHQRSWI